MFLKYSTLSMSSLVLRKKQYAFSPKCFKDIFELKSILGINNIAMWEDQLCGGRLKTVTWPHLGSEPWEMEQPGPSGGCPSSHAQGHALKVHRSGLRQVWPEANLPKQRVSPTHSRQAQRSTAPRLGVWASLWLLPSSIQGWTRKGEWGKQRSMWQGQGPWAHSRDNKAWLCVFYSFQYLPDPEGSLGHKVPRAAKTEGTKLM